MNVIKGLSCIIILFLLFFGYFEYHNHKKRLINIPLRIFVNGSRGKSTVTILISEVLKLAGYRVTARVTGTKAVHILDDGSEITIRRKVKPRIVEVLDTFKIAAERKSDAVVVECMALLPEYQNILSNSIVKPTHIIITNVREDHLDVMGPKLPNVAEAFGSTFNQNGIVVTADKECIPIFRKIADKRSAKIIYAGNITFRTEFAMELQETGFLENYQVVSALCEALEIPKETILSGLLSYVRGSGISNNFKIPFGKGYIRALNLFDVNDPDSTEMIIEKSRVNKNIPLLIIYNHRADRVNRGVGFCRFFINKLKEYNIAGIVFVGECTLPLYRQMIKEGFPLGKLIRVKTLDKIDEFWFRILTDLDISHYNISKELATVIGVGNIAGDAKKILKYWDEIKGK